MKQLGRTDFLFVTVATNAIGMGHLNRCLSVASTVGAGCHASFFVFGDQSTGTRLDSSGYEYLLAPPDVEPDRNTVGELRARAARADVVVVDMIYGRFFTDGFYRNLFDELHSVSRTLAAFDSLGPQSLVHKAPQVELDVLVVPYALSKVQSEAAASVGQVQLLGTAFAVVSSEFTCIPNRSHREVADRILITCGGSDPMNWTPLILDCLNTVDTPLDIRVIVGPLFSSTLIGKVRKSAHCNRHAVMLVMSPECLAEHMVWCDMAISASGLTKYELAATGTPTLLFSIDDDHEDSNEPFSLLATAIDLGARPSPSSIAAECCRILDDHELRKTLGAASQSAIDGQGANRLVSELEGLKSCRNMH